MPRTKSKATKPVIGKKITSKTQADTAVITPEEKNGARSNGHTNGHANGKSVASSDDHFSDLDLKNLLRVLMEVKNGNFEVRLPIDHTGLTGKICDTFNDIVSMNERMMHEFTRAGNTIGKQGK